MTSLQEQLAYDLIDNIANLSDYMLEVLRSAIDTETDRRNGMEQS